MKFACAVCRALYRSGAGTCPRDGGELVGLQGGDDPLVGATIAERYQLEDVVGDGGSGRVYRARHVESERRCAVQIVAGELAASEDVRARFRGAHPGANMGETEDGLLFVAMELDGEGAIDSVPPELEKATVALVLSAPMGRPAPMQPMPPMPTPPPMMAPAPMMMAPPQMQAPPPMMQPPMARPPAVYGLPAPVDDGTGQLLALVQEGRKPWVLIGIVVGLLVGGAVALSLVLRGGDDEAEAAGSPDAGTQVAAAAPAPAPAPAPAATPVPVAAVVDAAPVAVAPTPTPTPT
ncbi:MAG TPA: hypothetical protein VMZ28_04650, partial [Kofleriaceae bacterium]|nr:hypothetical protein [Kofleriaceae bacterium]